MTFYEAYIGDLEDRDFSWVDGDWNGNVPWSIGPFFPPTGKGRGYPRSAFAGIVTRIGEGSLDGKQTDWGGWVAKVEKDEILRLIDFLYPAQGRPVGEPLDHLDRSLDEFISFAKDLSDSRKYALAARET